jgi:hypothetical protein
MDKTVAGLSTALALQWSDPVILQPPLQLEAAVRQVVLQIADPEAVIVEIVQARVRELRIERS